MKTFPELSADLVYWLHQSVTLEAGSHIYMDHLYEKYLAYTRSVGESDRVKRKSFVTVLKRTFQDEIDSEVIKIHYAGRSTVLGIKIKKPNKKKSPPRTMASV